MSTDLARVSRLSLPEPSFGEETSSENEQDEEEHVDGFHSELNRCFLPDEASNSTGTRSASAPPAPSSTSAMTGQDVRNSVNETEDERGHPNERLRNIGPYCPPVSLVSSSSGIRENPDARKMIDDATAKTMTSAAAAGVTTVRHLPVAGFFNLGMPSRIAPPEQSASSSAAIQEGHKIGHIDQGDGIASIPSQTKIRSNNIQQDSTGASPLVPVVRPSPLKTTPPIASNFGVTIVAPKPRGVQTLPLRPSSPSPATRTKQEPIKKENRQTAAGGKQAWCDEATALARRNKEEKKKRQVEEQRRRQELQCNFPEQDSDPINMSPTNGRAAAANGHTENGRGTADQYGSAQREASRNQQQARSSKDRTSSASSDGGIGNRGTRSNNINVRNEEGEASSRAAHQQPPTPLFERLVTEEVQEIKSYVRIIENQSRRLSELERFHGDLEARLEVESRGRQYVEATLEAREREWSHRFNELESERDHWKAVVQAEQTKNSRLIDQVVRKDQDIHRMLQRKYDHEGNIGRSIRNIQRPNAERTDRTGASSSNAASRSPEIHHHKSPHEILAASGSVEAVRKRNVKGLLYDFFGL